MIPEQKWPIAKEGIPFVALAAVITLIIVAMGWLVPACFAFLLTLFVAFFFRNPKRHIPEAKNAILSPADGTIVDIGECLENRILKENALKVSIFMSILDVHLNRSPITGKVLEKRYNPGQFCVASRDKSSLLNEQNALLLETEDRFKMLLVQIAGFVARRIVCYPKPGDRMRKGEIFGLIRFGSRVDLYLPTSIKPIVSIGQHVKGGESIIGYRV